MRIPKPFMAVLVGITERLGKGSSIINRDKLKELNYVHWTCDSSKAAEDFKFVPKVTIKEGIKWTADWYRIHQWL
jgi:nucleoside-diphosphate-sugar epimerase